MCFKRIVRNRALDFAEKCAGMIWVTDDKGNCTYICQEWCDFTGQSLSQALGSGWINAVHPEDRQIIAEGFAEACRHQTEFMLTYRLRRHDGEYSWVIDTASPSFIPLTRGFIGYLGIVTGYDPEPSRMIARAEIGSFAPGKAMAEFGPVTALDTLADHLIHAKAIALTCAPAVAKAIDEALYIASQELVSNKRNFSLNKIIQ